MSVVRTPSEQACCDARDELDASVFHEMRATPNLTFHSQFTSLERWSDQVDSKFGCGGPQRLNGVG